ncbi:MAG TPA: hypothetical protein VEH04_16995 [Verrucomicrobiae bacterium]|nr:hypothetical protein [Verrucomicrobiae bacterium]
MQNKTTNTPKKRIDIAYYLLEIIGGPGLAQRLKTEVLRGVQLPPGADEPLTEEEWQAACAFVRQEAPALARMLTQECRRVSAELREQNSRN